MRLLKTHFITFPKAKIYVIALIKRRNVSINGWCGKFVTNVDAISARVKIWKSNRSITFFLPIRPIRTLTIVTLMIFLIPSSEFQVKNEFSNISLMIKVWSIFKTGVRHALFILTRLVPQKLLLIGNGPTKVCAQKLVIVFTFIKKLSNMLIWGTILGKLRLQNQPD